ncbi:MAG: cell division protein FtsQ/DivIB, partial [Planctomycetota bacterium]
LTLAFYLARAATDAAAQSPTFFVDPTRAVLEEAPPWLPPEWAAEAQAALRDLHPFSIFDSRGTEDAERALRGLGWVRSVERAGRTFPRTARLRIRVRRPVARVDSAGGSALLDEEGKLLPSPGPEREAFLPPLPRLVATRGDFGVPPGLGLPWRDRRVRTGVAAAVEVRSLVLRRGPSRVVAIDVTDADGKEGPLASPVVLLAEGGARILWGRPAAERAFGELSTAAKLDALSRVEATYPMLGGVREVDLRFDRPVVFADSSRLADAH